MPVISSRPFSAPFSAWSLALTLALLGATAVPSLAQDESFTRNSSVLGQSYGLPGQMDVIEDGQTDLVVETGVFFKNLELIGFEELDGRTFFGAIAPIRLRHALSDSVSVELGAVAGHDFGDDDALSDVDPLVRIVAKVGDDAAFIAGTLVSSHWAHQALFDDTNAFRDLTEQGLQVRVDRPRFKHDSWVNWRIEEGAIEAEEFEIGTTTRLGFLDDALRLDAQVLYTHAGGQISTSRRVDNDFAVLGGLSYGVAEPGGWARISDLRVGVNGLVNSRDRKGEEATSGSGFELYAQSDVDFSDRLFARFGVGHFEGDDFIAPRGDALYSFPSYTWGRGSWVWALTDDVAAEIGGTLQHADGQTNYTANINFTVNTAFLIDGISRR